MTIAPIARLNQPQQAVVSAAGACTLTFTPPPLGQQNTGTITVWGSPHGVVWNINLNNTTIATTVGNAGIGNIQCQDTDTLTVTATGLQPGVVIQASYVGLIEDKSQGAVVAPDGSNIQTINSPAARVAFGPQTFVTSINNTFTVQLQSTDRRMVVIFDAPLTGFSPVRISLTGVQSAINWAGLLPNPQIAGSTNGGYLEIPIFGTIDQTATLLIQPTGGGFTATVTVLAFSDEYTPGTPGNPLSVVDSLGAYTGFRQVIANGGAGGVLIAPPNVGFVNDIAMVGIWSNGITTTAAALNVFGTTTLVDLAGGWANTGVAFIDRRSFNGLRLTEGLTSSSNASGVGVVSEVYYRIIPVLE